MPPIGPSSELTHAGRPYELTLLVSTVLVINGTSAYSVVTLNQRRRQSLGGQHGKGVDRLFEKVSVESG